MVTMCATPAATGSSADAPAPSPGALPPAPRSPLDARGAPAFGLFAGEVPEAERIAEATLDGAPLLRRGRWKRWVYAFVGGPAVRAGFAVADVGYVGNAFGYAWPAGPGVPPGAKVEAHWLAPAALGVRVQGGLASVHASAWTPGKSIEVRAEGTGVRLTARLPRLEADVRFERLDVPVSVISRLGEGAGLTLKAAGMPVSGRIRCDGQEVSLEGHLGVLDWTSARFGWQTDWNWVSVTGLSREGRPVGANLCRGVHDETRETGHTENVLWLEGRPGALPRIEVSVGAPGEPWRAKGSEPGGALVDLTLTPDGERREDTNLGVVSSRFRQPFGRWSGTLVDREGRRVELGPAWGVAEDHHARW